MTAAGEFTLAAVVRVVRAASPPGMGDFAARQIATAAIEAYRRQGARRGGARMTAEFPGALLLAALAAATPAAAADRAVVPYAATVVRVVDGDTVNVDIPAWAGTPFTPIAIRVAGIDTPESRKPPGKCITEVRRGKLAHAFADTLLRPGAAIVIGYRGHDKYFRIDADVMIGPQSLADVMIARGYATPYGGGRKRNWCFRGAYPLLAPNRP